MKGIDFPDWRQVLAEVKLREKQRNSFQITIGWFLSFCRRGRGEITHQSARDFIEWAVEEKQPHSWQVEQWPRKKPTRLRERRMSVVGG